METPRDQNKFKWIKGEMKDNVANHNKEWKEGKDEKNKIFVKKVEEGDELEKLVTDSRTKLGRLVKDGKVSPQEVYDNPEKFLP